MLVKISKMMSSVTAFFCKFRAIFKLIRNHFNPALVIPFVIQVRGVPFANSQEIIACLSFPVISHFLKTPGGGGGWGTHPSHDFPPQNGIFNPDHQGARLGF